jgi:hypothetical protein
MHGIKGQALLNLVPLSPLDRRWHTSISPSQV